MKTLWQIFRAPLLLAGLTLLGLASALVGDGIADLLSWLSLGALVLVTLAKACIVPPPRAGNPE